MSKINSYRLSEDAFFKSYQLEPNEHNIEVKKYGINIRVQTIGSEQPLLFIHGGPMYEHMGSTCIIDAGV